MLVWGSVNSRSWRLKNHSVPSGIVELETGTHTQAAKPGSGTFQYSCSSLSVNTTACPNSASKSASEPRNARAGSANRFCGRPQLDRNLSSVVAGSSIYERRGIAAHGFGAAAQHSFQPLAQGGRVFVFAQYQRHAGGQFGFALP